MGLRLRDVLVSVWEESNGFGMDGDLACFEDGWSVARFCLCDVHSSTCRGLRIVMYHDVIFGPSMGEIRRCSPRADEL